MTDSFTLPLRPLKKKTEKQDNLAIRIAQINAQRGSFRNVTEASLQAEIDALRAAGRDPNESVDEKAAPENETLDRQEQLLKSRAEILEFAMQAHAEATYALDFVSLALSKHNPRQAEMSLSPHLKLKAPLGSLGVDVVQTPEPTEAEQTDVNTVSRGWKLESFTSAADKLLQSATQLEQTVAAETQYWSEVLEVKEKGWKVCRLPREKQTLGVQFGFMEATHTFRDRGLAALRKGEGGKLLLDQGIRASTPKVVRVRVQQDDQIVGSSILPTMRTTDTGPVEEHIRQARDSLFEEELFYELNREARALMKHGVEVRRNLIQFPAEDDQDILIDLVDLDESGTGPDDNHSLADAIAQSFRILLSHAHRKNLHRRSQIPPPVTSKKRSTPEYTLLSPIFSYLQHRSHLRWLTSFLNNFTGTLRSAGLNCTPNSFPLTSKRTSRAQDSGLPAIESFVDDLLSPLESYLTVPLCSPSCGFRVRVFTNLHPTGFGTEFAIETTLPALSHATKTPLKLGLRDDVEQFIIYMYTIDLSHFISTVSQRIYPSPSPDTTKAAPTPESDEWEDEDVEEKVNPVARLLGIKPSPSAPLLKSMSPTAKNAYLLPWELSSPESGELTAFSPAKNRTKKLFLELADDTLEIRVSWMGTSLGITGPAENEDKLGLEEEKYVWRATDGEEQASLEQAIETMGKLDQKAEP